VAKIIAMRFRRSLQKHFVEKYGIAHFMEVRKYDNKLSNAMFGKVFKHVEENFDWKKEGFAQQFNTMYPFIIKQRIKFSLTSITNTVSDDFVKRATRMVAGWLKFRKDVR
jgi:ribosome-associated toxin RatA of RatAB toxin-antitoxin module